MKIELHFFIPLRTEHPPSPHIPPSNIDISEDQVKQFKDDGFLVFKNILSEALIKTLNSASKDIRTNKTLHCEMTYYNGPPIFHKVSSLSPNNWINWHICSIPISVHGRTRFMMVSVMFSIIPLLDTWLLGMCYNWANNEWFETTFILIRLMGNYSVRLLGATTMGSSTGDYTIPQ